MTNEQDAKNNTPAMDALMPAEIYAWTGFQEGGSWDKKPCPCCECVRYIRADLPASPVRGDVQEAFDLVQGHARQWSGSFCDFEEYEKALTAIETLRHALKLPSEKQS